jgi:glucokinase
MPDNDQDLRTVMTLDAGGTSFRFSAIRGNRPVAATISMPSNGDNLERCLANISNGFSQVAAQCPTLPVAISFAFPGPADYPNGIIGDQKNLPGFRGGVALGPMLEEQFGIPVFINNDADLFVYGEAIAGFLPYVNNLLAQAGSPKRFQNLLGVTLGTGFGGGIVRKGELFVGDNSMAGEIWAFRNKLNPRMCAEEGASIRAVRRIYAQQAGIPAGEAPDPRVIEQIALGQVRGEQEAAIESYRRLGEIVGDALCQALTLIDGLAVIGGNISKASPLFMPAIMGELSQLCFVPNQDESFKLRRLTAIAFNLEDPEQLAKFLAGETREITVPGSQRRVKYDPLQRVGIGISRLGTSEAVAIGAYAFALQKLGAV